MHSRDSGGDTQFSSPAPRDDLNSAAPVPIIRARKGLATGDGIFDCFDCEGGTQLIELDQLTRRFGRTLAVNGLDFKVGPGEVLGFLGPNGAGKTTTMKLVTGFLAPTSGAVRLFGEPVGTHSHALRRRLGYLPEGAPLYGEMTPRELLDFVLRLQRPGVRGTAAAKALAAVVEPLALGSVLDRRIEDLSKGFRRRVGLAAALIHDPDVLLLDEPTDGLDPNQKHQVRALIRNLSQEKIVIVSTHILEEVEAVCTRALLIAAGRKVADDTPERLAARSRWHGAITLASHATTLRDRLTGLGAVAAIETDNPAGDRLTVFPSDALRADAPTTCGERLLAQLRRELPAQDFDVIGIHTGRMDDVFRELTINATVEAA